MKLTFFMSTYLLLLFTCSNDKLSYYFNIHLKLLNIFGLWTDMRFIGGSLTLTIIYSILAILLFIIAPQFCHVVYMYKARDNVVAFADEFYVSLASVIVVFKDYDMIRKRKIISEMLDTMDSEIMQPSKGQTQKIHKVMSFWKKLFWSLLTFESCFCLCQLITPIIDKIQTGTKNVPLVDCYPFYIYASPVYEIMYIYQSFLLSYLLMHSMLFDTFVTGLMSFCAAECDILFENLMALKLEETEVVYRTKLVKCIKHHEEICRFATNIEKCFSPTILGQYFCSLISACTTMFKLSLVSFNSTK
ncbi:unnamed protein product [Psylliodes chrysocephalus]|uniref:Uncharacterized protein n=1 Tax=Psylliodes chrysocephalus TaxID=3402493 RepID=A0A9P0GIM6_9CUCU|nr:unnamed protein product [Psylliodes chrysocephala]